MTISGEQLWIVALFLVTAILVPYVRYLAAQLAALKDSLSQTEREMTRIVTIIGERAKTREEDRAELSAAMRDLKAAIKALDDRLHEKDHAR